MKRLYATILLGLVLLLSLSACQNWKDANAANKVAMEWFKPFTQEGETANEFWGFEVTTIFGPVCPTPDWFGSLIYTKIKVVKDADVPTFEKTFKCWLKGTDELDMSVKISRDVVVTLKVPEPEAPVQIESYKFANEKPLSGWKQAGMWLLWCFLGPILPILAFWWIFNWMGILAFPATRTIAALVLVAYVGQVSHWVYGSWWAVAIGIAIYLVVMGFIIGVIMSAQQS